MNINTSPLKGSQVKQRTTTTPGDSSNNNHAMDDNTEFTNEVHVFSVSKRAEARLFFPLRMLLV